MRTREYLEPATAGETSSRRDGDRFTRLLAQEMRGGLVIASGLLLAGLALWSASWPASGSDPLAGANLVVSPSAGAWAILVVAGLVVLAITPVVRVLVSAVFFGRRGDRRYVYLTTFVLVVLAASALVGWLA